MDEAFDERSRRLQGTVIAIADGVAGFVRRPGATVRVIDKRSGGDWRRYAQRIGSAFTDTNHLTETLRRGLPEVGRGQGWRSQRAAVDALAEPEAEYAVVAEAGDDGPVTVVTFVRDEDHLLVVGGGTTFPSVPAGVLADASLPTGEQAGFAAQYALASIAARETLTVSHRVSPDAWHGPRAVEARRLISANGNARTTKAQTWSAADARHLTEQVTLRQLDGRHPFPQVESQPAGRLRRYATELKDWIDRGGTLEVYDHGDEQQRDAADLAMLELASNADGLAQSPLPARSGVRTVVAMSDGRPRALLTAGRNASGDLHVLRTLAPNEPAASRAAELAMTEAARRTGGGVTFSEAAAQELGLPADYSMTAADAVADARDTRTDLAWLDKESATRMSELLQVLDGPAEPEADPAELAAAVQRFRESGGDVLYLRPSDPRFVALQEKASEVLWAASEKADGAVPAGVDGLWRALNPPATDHGDSRQRVAVAVVDGTPVAAAGLTVTAHRQELGELGAVPGADDGLVAAVVEGAYAQVGDKPLNMFLAADDVKSEQFAAVGLQVTGVRPLDDDSRVEVRLPDAVRKAALKADVETGWRGAGVLDDAADDLRYFQDRNGSVRRLDHAVAADRQAAEEITQAAAVDNPPTLPPVSGHRVTAVAQRAGRDPAYVTFDETPAGQIEVVDVAANGHDPTAQEAVRYWFCHQLAERDREPVLHERISGNGRALVTWQPGESRYFVAGIRNRLGDRPAELLRPATPTADPRGPGRADPAQSARPRTGGPDSHRRGPMER